MNETTLKQTDFDLDLPSAADPIRLHQLACEARDAICGLWDDRRSTFWRSTIHRKRDERKRAREFFPTATIRCVEALLFLVGDFPLLADPSAARLLTKKALPALAAHDLSTFRSTLDTSGPRRRLNLFTLSLYVQAIARANVVPGLDAGLAELVAVRLKSALRTLLKHPDIRGGNAATVPTLHPFLAFHVCRAASLASGATRGSMRASASALAVAMRAASRTAVETLLAREQVGALNPSEAIALGFCAGTLAQHSDPEDEQYVVAALRVCLEAQDSQGCWPLGRVVELDKDIGYGRLEIPTFEVTSVVVASLCALLAWGGRRSVPEVVLNALENAARAVRWAETSMIRLKSTAPPFRGWSSDHAYDARIVESWTSATVLQSVLAIGQLNDALQQKLALASFDTSWPQDPGWPSWLQWKRYRREGEIDRRHPVLRYVDLRMIQPILQHPRHLPAERPRSVSALLFGPPGTSKTTIVRGVASALGWPVVLLNPGVFIARGLEFIEAQAQSVFSRLMRLSRVVVLFDECDELFRYREPTVGTEQTRNITAFVTASMLPKMQELHDRGRVLFFICTDNLDSMDSAIKRGGRIDHIIGVGPPDRTARRRIIREAMEAVQKESSRAGHPRHLAAIESTLAECTERFTRPELERAVRSILLDASWSTKRDAEARATRAANALKDGLVIPEPLFDKFKAAKESFCHVVARGV